MFSKGFQEKSKARHQTYASDLAKALKESRQQHADNKYIQVFAVIKVQKHPDVFRAVTAPSARLLPPMPHSPLFLQLGGWRLRDRGLQGQQEQNWKK